MANRYGRNQKRRARADLEAARLKAATAEHRADMEAGKAWVLEREMKAWDDEIRRSLGAYSAARRTPDTVQDTGATGHFRIPLPRKLMVLSEYSAPTAAVSEAIGRFVTLVEAITDSDRVLMQNALGFRVKIVRYGQETLAVWHSIPEREIELLTGPVMVGDLSRQIAEQMMAHLQGADYRKTPSRKAG